MIFGKDIQDAIDAGGTLSEQFTNYQHAITKEVLRAASLGAFISQEAIKQGMEKGARVHC